MQHPGHAHSIGFDSEFQHSLSDAMAAGRWQELVAGMGADVAESVRGTLNSVAQLVDARRLDAHEARFLQGPLRRLYQVGVAAQRLSRLADHPRITDVESIALDDVVTDAVAHYQKRSRSHRIAIDVTPLDVLAKPESLACAIDALLQWGMKLGRVLNLRLVKPAGSHSGELWLRVESLTAAAHEERNLNSVDWHVLWQVARLKGVKVKRKVEQDRIRVRVSFQRELSQHSGMAILEQGYEDSSQSFDASNATVWSILPSAWQTALVESTLEPHLPNLVTMPNLAAIVARDVMPPDCIVSIAEVLETDEFRRWRRKAQEKRGRTIAVIELTAKSNVFDIGGLGSRAVARLSVDSVGTKLMSAVVFELSQLSNDLH